MSIFEDDPKKNFFQDKWEDFIFFCEEWHEDAKLMGFWYPFEKIISNIWMTLVWQWIRRIVRVIQWIPVLWNNYDWDYIYILNVLDYKLARTQKAIKNGLCLQESIDEKVGQIQEVRDIIDQIIKNNFVESEQKAHEEKWGELKIRTTPCKDSRLSQLHFYYTKTENDEKLNKQASDENIEIHKLEEKRTEEAYNKLFSLLAKNIRGWWD